MATNPLGKGTVNVTVNMPTELRQRLQRLAEASHCSLSEYLRRILTEAIESGVVWETAKPVKRTLLGYSLEPAGAPATAPAAPITQKPPGQFVIRGPDGKIVDVQTFEQTPVATPKKKIRKPVDMLTR